MDEFRCLTMFQNETTNKFSREIPLEHVTLQLNTDTDREHYFEMRTGLNFYYCGCNRTQSRVRSLLSLSLSRSLRSFRNTISPIRFNTLAMPTLRFVKLFSPTITMAAKRKVFSPSSRLDLNHETSTKCTSSIRSKCSAVDSSERFTEVKKTTKEGSANEFSLLQVIHWRRTNKWRSK